MIPVQHTKITGLITQDEFLFCKEEKCRRSELRQLNSGEIYRKVGRADCRNDFSNTLQISYHSVSKKSYKDTLPAAFFLYCSLLFPTLLYISRQQKKPGNLTVPGYLTFGHNVPYSAQYILYKPQCIHLHDTLIPFYLIFFMVFSPKYSEKRIICTMYFNLPGFLAPFWHQTPWSKRFSSTANRCYSTNFILHR